MSEVSKLIEVDEQFMLKCAETIEAGCSAIKKARPRVSL